MKGFLAALLPVVMFLAALAALIPAHSVAETVIRDLSGTKVIRSHESPHNILGEACVACHPKEKFDFWLLIYKGRAPSLTVEGALDNGAGKAGGSAAGASEARNRYNAHDALSCNFCHFGNPKESSPRFIVEVGSLCQLCHPGTGMHRTPEGEDLQRVIAAVAAGKLPGIEGKTACTTCHKVHEATYSIRESYARILYEGRIPNPHVGRLFCFSCHPGSIREGKEVRLSTGKDLVKLCTDCHLQPGVSKAPHVVGVIASEGTWKTEYLGYPLQDGKLTCVTCHDEGSHRKPDPANPKFLRGGPYSDLETFCGRCHLERAKSRGNPHHQLDGFGRLRPDACRFCHAGVPDPSKPGAPEAALVADEAAVCSNCHRIGPHPVAEHIKPMTPQMEGRRKDYEQRHQVRLPLGEGGMIRCSTCHNPHSKGVIKGEAGVGAGSLWRVPDFREVCAPCHGRY